jgi:DNA-binding NarL/FixJ family response regulator
MESNGLCGGVLVAINNRVLRESLCQVLNNLQTEYICYTDFPAPDLVLFDSSKTLEPLLTQYPNAKFILMDSGLKEQEVSYLLFHHKISGVIQPNTSMEMFLKALSVVYSGQIWLDNKHLKSLLQGSGFMGRNGDLKTLSQQDKKIVRLVTQGLKNKEIAAQLCLSEHTIKAHLSRIFKTLNIHRRAQLMSLILENGQS